MTEVLYQSTVTEIGELVPAFIAEGILVFFGESAPEELRTFAIIHKVDVAQGQVAVGDQISLDGVTFPILAVGSVANENLYNLGHLNLKANGNTEPDLPGDVCIPVMELPAVKIGTEIKITRSN